MSHRIKQGNPIQMTNYLLIQVNEYNTYGF